MIFLLETKNFISQLEELKKDADPLKINVIDDILDHEDDAINYIKDVATHGCISGIVTSLIYYTQTTEFFNKHYDDIMGLVQEHEDATGQRVQHDGDMRNWFSWFAYEESIYNIANQLEINF